MLGLYGQAKDFKDSLCAYRNGLIFAKAKKLFCNKHDIVTVNTDRTNHEFSHLYLFFYEADFESVCFWEMMVGLQIFKTYIKSNFFPR